MKNTQNLVDKNGITMKTGDIVKVSGSYFKSDNGLYFVEHSPEDPNWCGSDHCLKKICNNGKVSTATRSVCFWPVTVFVNDHSKCCEAKRWNAEHCEIEIQNHVNHSFVAEYFSEQADQMQKRLQRDAWDYGEDSETVKTEKATIAHFRAVVDRLAM